MTRAKTVGLNPKPKKPITRARTAKLGRLWPMFTRASTYGALLRIDFLVITIPSNKPMTIAIDDPAATSSMYCSVKKST
jgi:hypothetical protein